MNNSKVIYSVSDLTHQIKLLLEDSFPSLWVEGEISNFKNHYSGHLYFTLKDQSAQISCVMWKSRTASIPFDISDGMKLHLFGNLRVFEKSGRYQLDVILMQEAGVGELQLKFEQLKKQLLDEGLFDESNKNQIPQYPENIAVITSPTGAAIKDILSVIERRYPICNILIGGVKVQGDGAAQEIVNAINYINQVNDVDLIILGRGGGSLEDLWAFNEEIVARAIFGSKIPIISAVGHDIDFTISDFVADLRAPTPSAAAELAVPDINEVKPKIFEMYNFLTANLTNLISISRTSIEHYLKSYAFKQPEDLVRQYANQVDLLVQKIITSLKENVNHDKLKVLNLLEKLNILQPDHALKRGYAIVQKDNHIIKSINKLEIDDLIDIKLSDGQIKSRVSEKKS